MDIIRNLLVKRCTSSIHCATFDQRSMAKPSQVSRDEEECYFLLSEFLFRSVLTYSLELPSKKSIQFDLFDQVDDFPDDSSRLSF